MKLVPQCDAVQVEYTSDDDVNSAQKQINFMHQLVSGGKLLSRIKKKLKNSTEWIPKEKKFLCRFVLFTHSEWSDYVDKYQKKWFEAGKEHAKKDASEWRKEGRMEALEVIQKLEDKYRNMLATEFVDRFKEEDERVGGKQPVKLPPRPTIPLPEQRNPYEPAIHKRKFWEPPF